ncbi:GIY-YIG nuclease family protein [Winogradskyella litorisediminis]|uniref:GIY-YIG nuclease family protein n=1 Tax=Winogradskyella litorisediminis TaxID=1156618 RepID=A0ABW3N6T7_9FLAO
MHYVYIIYSNSFDRYYVGMTKDISVRLNSHNAKKVKSTKAFVPWVVKYIEEFETRIDARKREKYLKSAAGRRWRRNNMGN